MGVSKRDIRRSNEITGWFDPSKYKAVHNLTTRGIYNLWMQREPLRVNLSLFVSTGSPTFQAYAQEMISDIQNDPLMGSTVKQLNSQQIDYSAINSAAVRAVNLIDIAAIHGCLSRDYPEIYAEAVQVAEETTRNNPATAMRNAALFNQFSMSDGMVSNVLEPYMIAAIDMRASEKRMHLELSSLVQAFRNRLELTEEQRNAKVSMWKKYLIPVFYDVYLAHLAFDARLVFSEVVKHVLPRKPHESRSALECKRQLDDYIRACSNGALTLVDEQN